jgi:hypothetical protein
LHEAESDLHDWADYQSFYFQSYIEKDIKDVLNIQGFASLSNATVISVVSAISNYKV